MALTSIPYRRFRIAQWIAAAAVFSLSYESPAAAADIPRYFVLSVGINQYADPLWPALRFAESDATRFAAEMGEVDGYRKTTVILTGADATRKNILAALGKISSAAKPTDVVVLYFSMHGTLQANADGDLDNTLVVADTTSSKLASTGLSQNEIRRQLNRTRARRKLAVFATCHSGIGKSVIPERIREIMSSRKGKVEDITSVSEGAVVLSAAAQGEAARESAQLGSDVYTHFLLRDLAAADRNRDGIVSALEAHDRARDATFAFSKGKQRPTVESSIIGDGDIPLLGKKTAIGSPTMMAYNPNYAGFGVTVNDQTKGTAPIGLVLRSGPNVVAVTAPGADEPFARFELQARPGQGVMFEDLFAPPPYFLSVDLGLMWWSDAGLRRLLPGGLSQELELTFGRRWGAWQLGGQTALGIGGRSDALPGLDSVLRTIGGSVMAGYAWTLTPQLSAWTPVYLGLDFALGAERLQFELSEGDQSSVAAFSTAPNLSFEISLARHWLRLAYRRAYAEHDLGEVGHIGGERDQWSVGLLIGLGGVATRQRGR